MIIKKMLKKIISFLILIFSTTNLNAENHEFDIWLTNFKLKAIKSGVSENVVNDVMSNAKFLPRVIEYDRYQPEFYEDTHTYINKRANNKKLKKV